jgi:CRISPR-associated endonuclease/helicase Cas3
MLAYLVCAHHGKVSESWQASPRDQDFPLERPDFSGVGQPLLGVRQGDILPSIVLTTASGGAEAPPDLVLHLDLASMGLSSRYGASWSERVHDLIGRHGPFALAYLEALLRVADVRASRLETPDPLLAAEGVK